ncbi:IclR family transcriptional regulator [Paracoccus pacificus]|uniref:IclR family transcriptional regulator n=1 Tax=Paracoccus pacificus TaxID=1463598 RepID=A0ABW4R3Y3_9RHOB
MTMHRLLRSDSCVLRTSAANAATAQQIQPDHVQAIQSSFGDSQRMRIRGLLGRNANTQGDQPMSPSTSTNSSTSRGEGSQSIGRAINLLSIVAERGEAGTRLSDVAEQSGLHLATTRRILQALVADGFLAFNTQTKLYSVGPAIFSFAVKGSPWFARREIFMPVLDRIAEQTRDTVLFSVRSGSEAVCLARREGEFPIRVLSLEAGSRRPLGAGSGSLAILAFLPSDERQALIRQNASLYDAFKLSAADVAQMVTDTRRTGFSFNPARIIDGVYGVAVPILVNGEAVASISVTAIASRMSVERRLEIAQVICRELLSITGIQIPGNLVPINPHDSPDI